MTINKLNVKDLEKVTGGRMMGRPTCVSKKCSHSNKVRTGNEQENYYFLSLSHHQFEYECQDCGALIWVNEDA